MEGKVAGQRQVPRKDSERNPKVRYPNPKRGMTVSTHLDAAIANGRTAEIQERFTLVPIGLFQDKGISRQQALVTAAVHDKLEAGDLASPVGLDPVLGEEGYRSTQTGSEAARRHHGDRHVGAGEGFELMAHGVCRWRCVDRRGWFCGGGQLVVCGKAFLVDGNPSQMRLCRLLGEAIPSCPYVARGTKNLIPIDFP